jgi:hypothetical protein
MNFLIKAVSNYKVILIIVLLFAMFASFQSLVQKKKTYTSDTIQYTNYNNYIIFKQSFSHLAENKDLYKLYPEEQWDLYKYSPTFAMFFGIFALFPDVIGLNLWNILNALLLLLAIYYLPKLTVTQKGLIVLISLIELMTSMQNEQSNGMVAGLLILAFALLEKRHYAIATFCIVFSIYIKLFGIVGLALYLFYPGKWKLALYTAGWSLLLLLLPLLMVDIHQLKYLYQSWGGLLEMDHSASYGFSVMGWIKAWFGLDINKTIVALAGAVVFLIPFVRIKSYPNYIFRLLALCSVLIWVIIFNHKAESPTFIIAMAGVAIWFISGKKSPLNITLFVLAFVFTSLSPTDIFPRALRESLVIPYSLKVFPCILIWVKIIYDMLAIENDPFVADAIKQSDTSKLQE